jgi:hypothetical protein
VENNEAVTAVENNEAVTAVENNEAVTAVENNEAVTAVENNETVTAAENDEAMTAAERDEVMAAANKAAENMRTEQQKRRNLVREERMNEEIEMERKRDSRAKEDELTLNTKKKLKEIRGKLDTARKEVVSAEEDGVQLQNLLNKNDPPYDDLFRETLRGTARKSQKKAQDNKVIVENLTVEFDALLDVLLAGV